MRLKAVVVPVVLSILMASAPAQERSEKGQPRNVEVTPKTFAAALATAKPGDTLLMADGVYEGGFSLRSSGTAGAWIEIRALGENAVVDASGQRRGLWLDGASWVKVHGVRFSNATEFGLLVDKSNHVEVERCTFTHNSRALQLIGSKHVVVALCDLSQCTGTFALGIRDVSSDIVIRGNRVHDNGLGAVIIASSLHLPEVGGVPVRNVLLENNVICRNGGDPGSGAALIFESVQDSVIRNNLFHHNTGRGIMLYATPGIEATPEKGASNNEIYNNTVYFAPEKGERCLWIFEQSAGNKIKNNIFIGGMAGVIYVEPSCFEGTECDHNVIANHRGRVLIGDSSEDVPEMVARWLELGYDKHSYFAVTPSFVDAEGADFRLAPGSIGVDMGTNLGDKVKNDIDGVSRPQGAAFDCGCYETK